MLQIFCNTLFQSLGLLYSYFYIVQPQPNRTRVEAGIVAAENGCNSSLFILVPSIDQWPEWTCLFLIIPDQPVNKLGLYISSNGQPTLNDQIQLVFSLLYLTILEISLSQHKSVGWESFETPNLYLSGVFFVGPKAHGSRGLY